MKYTETTEQILTKIMDGMVFPNPTVIPSGPQRFESIVAAVCKSANITREQLLQVTRGTRETSHARMVAMWACYTMEPKWTLTYVAELFNRDRTSVSHAIKVIDENSTEILRVRVEQSLRGRP